MGGVVSGHTYLDTVPGEGVGYIGQLGLCAEVALVVSEVLIPLNPAWPGNQSYQHCNIFNK